MIYVGVLAPVLNPLTDEAESWAGAVYKWDAGVVYLMRAFDPEQVRGVASRRVHQELRTLLKIEEEEHGTGKRRKGA